MIEPVHGDEFARFAGRRAAAERRAEGAAPGVADGDVFFDDLFVAFWLDHGRGVAIWSNEVSGGMLSAISPLKIHAKF